MLEAIIDKLVVDSVRAPQKALSVTPMGGQIPRIGHGMTKCVVARPRPAMAATRPGRSLVLMRMPPTVPSRLNLDRLPDASAASTGYLPMASANLLQAYAVIVAAVHPPLVGREKSDMTCCFHAVP